MASNETTACLAHSLPAFADVDRRHARRECACKGRAGRSSRAESGALCFRCSAPSTSGFRKSRVACSTSESGVRSFGSLSASTSTFAERGRWREYANAYGSIVWFLLVLHTHLVIDAIDTAVLAALLYPGPFEGKRFVDVSESALYWYFVVLSWLPIYAVIYIAPRMLGGLIMWVPGGVAFLLGALAVAWQWLARGPRTAQPHERPPLGAQPRLISGKQTR